MDHNAACDDRGPRERFQVVPCTNSVMASAGDKQHLCLGLNSLAKRGAKCTGRLQIHFATMEDLRQLRFDRSQPDVSRHVFRLKLDKYVDVTSRAKIAPQHRPEQRESSNMPASA